MANFKKRLATISMLTILAGPVINTPLLYAPQILAEENSAENSNSDANEASSITNENETNKENSSLSDVVLKESVAIADSSIFYIQVGYQFDDGSFDEWQKGTGFLVSNQEILTVQTLADTSTSSSLYESILDKKGDAYKSAGVDLKDEDEVEKHFVIKVTDVDGKSLAVKSSSAKNGLGLISLEKNVLSTPAIFAEESDVDSSEGAKYKFKLSSLDGEKEKISESEGTLVKPPLNSESSTLSMSGDSSGGESLGSPVYNDKGNVVGLISGTGETMTLVPTGGLQTFLTNNDVKFDTRKTAEKKEKAKQKASIEKNLEKTKNLVSVKKINKLIAKAEKISESSYTEKTYSNLENALKDAKKIVKSKSKSQAEVDSAEKKLNTAYSNLKKRSIFSKFAFVLLGFLVLIIVSVLSVVLFKRNKRRLPKPKKNKPVQMYPEDPLEKLKELESEDLKRDCSNKNNVVIERKNQSGNYEAIESGLDITDEKASQLLRNGTPNTPGITFARDDKYDSVADLAEKSKRFGVPLNNEHYDDGSGETTILNNAETMVLNSSAYLTRKGENKEIPIRDGFVVGKERRKVHYCIEGNPSVSRTHAQFHLIDGEYYIEDLQSKNYTFLNGIQLPFYQKALLKNGDVIRMSDVDFVFHDGK